MLLCDVLSDLQKRQTKNWLSYPDKLLHVLSEDSCKVRIRLQIGPSPANGAFFCSLKPVQTGVAGRSKIAPSINVCENREVTQTVGSGAERNMTGG